MSFETNRLKPHNSGGTEPQILEWWEGAPWTSIHDPSCILHVNMLSARRWYRYHNFAGLPTHFEIYSSLYADSYGMYRDTFDTAVVLLFPLVLTAQEICHTTAPIQP